MNTTGKKFGGREQGTPNKVTKDIKTAYKQLIENNIDNLEVWLNEIAEDKPEKAFEIIIKLSEYVLPKITKIDGTANKGETITDEDREEILKKLRNER